MAARRSPGAARRRAGSRRGCRSRCCRPRPRRAGRGCAAPGRPPAIRWTRTGLCTERRTMCGPTSSDTSILPGASWRDAFVSASFRQGSSTPQACTGTAAVSPCDREDHRAGREATADLLERADPDGRLGRDAAHRAPEDFHAVRDAPPCLVEQLVRLRIPSSRRPRYASRASSAAVISCPAWSWRSRAMRARSATSAMRATRTLAESSSRLQALQLVALPPVAVGLLPGAGRAGVRQRWTASPASAAAATAAVEGKDHARKTKSATIAGSAYAGRAARQAVEDREGRRRSAASGQKDGATAAQAAWSARVVHAGRGNLHRARPRIARTRTRIRPISLPGRGQPEPGEQDHPREPPQEGHRARRDPLLVHTAAPPLLHPASRPHHEERHGEQ